jgi:hypothetical protein
MSYLLFNPPLPEDERALHGDLHIRELSSSVALPPILNVVSHTIHPLSLLSLSLSLRLRRLNSAKSGDHIMLFKKSDPTTKTKRVFNTKISFLMLFLEIIDVYTYEALNITNKMQRFMIVKVGGTCTSKI